MFCGLRASFVVLDPHKRGRLWLRADGVRMLDC